MVVVVVRAGLPSGVANGRGWGRYHPGANIQHFKGEGEGGLPSGGVNIRHHNGRRGRENGGAIQLGHHRALQTGEGRGGFHPSE